MNRIIRVSAWVSKVVTLGVVALCLSCGGSSATSSTGSTNGGSGTSGGGSCSLAAGTYTIHYTVQSGSSTSCPPIPDKMTTVAANENASNLMAGSMTMGGTDGGANCTTSDTGCNVTQTCSETSSGVAFEITVSFTVGTNSVNGQVTETITSPAAGGSLTCNYAFTFAPS
jgi:hypothetical protein